MDHFHFSELPLELQCYVISQITDLNTALNLYHTNQTFRSLAGECITELRSDSKQQFEVDDLISYLKYFPNIHSLYNITVFMGSMSDVNKLNQIKHLKHVMFFVEPELEESEWSVDDLISAYLTQHCDQLTTTWMAFMMLGPNDFEFLVYDTDRIWLISHRNLSQSIQILTQCTGINTISVAKNKDPVPTWIQNFNLKIMTYELPTGLDRLLCCSPQVVNFFRQAYLGPSNPRDLNSPSINQILIFLNTGIANQLIMLTLINIYAIVNDLLFPKNPRMMLVTPLMKQWLNLSQDSIALNFVSSLGNNRDQEIKLKDSVAQQHDPETLVDINHDLKIVNNVVYLYRQFPELLQAVKRLL